MFGLHPRTMRVELVEGGSVALRCAAHFVESDHPVVAVECGILQTLCHYSGCELLKAKQKFSFDSSARAQCKHIANEVEKVRRKIGSLCLRDRYRIRNLLFIFFRNLVAYRRNVGSVDGEARGNLANGAPNLGARVVAAIAVVLAYHNKQLRQSVDIAA